LVPDVDQKIAEITNWLVIGPFANPDEKGIETVYAPETELVFGKMYEGSVSPITWTIPKKEVLGDMIDPLPWGTNYHWNYHNGGVAWAMQHLAEVTGEAKYNQYATNFCDFHINGAPFVNYQVKTLRAIHSANSNFLFSPLLDFTLAPALPFIYKLRKESSFANRDAYEKYIERMFHYAKYEQVRLPGSNIFTRLTPEKYTTWVDDMFMGIPFLIQAAQYAESREERKLFLDDAANQAVRYNEQVWNNEANLYMHAKYSGKDVKLPHWSRANGWGIWATTEVLMVLPKNHPNYRTILAHYRKHVDALVALQNKNGFWLQVLDRPDSREEVSGTAIFTMAIARGVTHGWLNARKYKPFALKGWEALKTQIKPDGNVLNICYGTMCSEDVNYYLNRPFYDNDTHGLFAVLFAGIEVSNMNKAGSK
jgi:unsaturated rhamnogalacturonyl hydrolase